MQGSSSGETIGQIIIWPTANWYQDIKTVGGDPDDYIECNGQIVNSSKYPKLAKIMSTVPNYQGLFLRGFGGNSEAIGQVQSDAIRNITGVFGSEVIMGGGNTDSLYASGAFYNFSSFASMHISSPYYDPGNNNVAMDISRVVPTAEENRPINTAVVYLIKAK